MAGIGVMSSPLAICSSRFAICLVICAIRAFRRACFSSLVSVGLPAASPFTVSSLFSAPSSFAASLLFSTSPLFSVSLLLAAPSLFFFLRPFFFFAGFSASLTVSLSGTTSSFFTSLTASVLFCSLRFFAFFAGFSSFSCFTASAGVFSPS